MPQKNHILKNANLEEFERAYDKCLVWFFANPNARTGLNELSKSVNSSKTATKQAVELLVNQALLYKEVIGKSWLLHPNNQHSYIRRKKISFHLGKIYETGIVEEVYKKFPQARAIILFGSYRWGTDIETSDIDIAIETLDNKKLEVRQLGIIGKMGYKKNVRVNLHIFSRKKIDLNLFANIANGIVLDGFLEVKP